MSESRTPRERMVYSAAQLVRERGVNGTGVRDVVASADAPRGSFQHYFPDGKAQLVSEALIWSGEFAAAHARAYAIRARRPTPSGFFAHLVAPWERELTGRDFARGCPIAATAADVAAADTALTEPLRAALDTWQGAVRDGFVAVGVPRARARRLATVVLSALEGALVLARARRTVEPLRTVVRELGPLLDSAVGT